MSLTTKTVVVGIDGATFDLILPWVEDGKLPNIGRVIRRGAWGNLQSVPNMISPAAWSSFLTGKNPGKHGIFFFNQRVPGSYRMQLINGSHRHGKTYVEILSEAGKKVGMINVFTTYPAREVNGFWISGLDAPRPSSKGFAYPPSVLDDIVSRFGEYVLFPPIYADLYAGRFEPVQNKILETLEYKAKSALHLMKNYPWDNFTVVFTATDTVQHYFWEHLENPELSPKLSDAIYTVYQRLDEIVGEILGQIDDDTVVIIMSDHGAGLAQHGADYLNRFLAELGLLNFARSPNQPSPLDTLLSRGYQLFRNHASRSLKGMVWELFPRLTERIQGRTAVGEFDWASTKAFVLSGLIWRPEIWINVKGRDPSGIVEPGQEYEALRDEIIEILMQTTDPVTGRPVVTAVEKREESYSGPYVDYAADLLVHWTYEFPISGLCYTTPNGRRICVADEGERESALESGSHRPQGILIMYGSPIREGYHLPDGANIVDMAPTILHLMGQPIPSDMDGQVLIDALEAAFREEVKYTTPATDPDPGNEGPSDAVEYDSEENREVEDRLRALGYLE